VEVTWRIFFILGGLGVGSAGDSVPMILIELGSPSIIGRSSLSISSPTGVFRLLIKIWAIYN